MYRFDLTEKSRDWSLIDFDSERYSKISRLVVVKTGSVNCLEVSVTYVRFKSDSRMILHYLYWASFTGNWSFSWICSAVTTGEKYTIAKKKDRGREHQGQGSPTLACLPVRCLPLRCLPTSRTPPRLSHPTSLPHACPPYPALPTRAQDPHCITLTTQSQ